MNGYAPVAKNRRIPFSRRAPQKRTKFAGLAKPAQPRSMCRQLAAAAFGCALASGWLIFLVPVRLGGIAD